jgi:hypothetical protein
MGGLISANIFRCDGADPLHIPICPLVTTAKDVTNFSGIDDFLQGPNGTMLVTYMGAKDLIDAVDAARRVILHRRVECFLYSVEHRFLPFW